MDGGREMTGSGLELAPQVRPQVSIQTVVNGMHRRSSTAPIRLANEHGAFGTTAYLTVFPMVIDANVLRDEVLRTVHSGQRTILCNAANIGVLRLLCADHVIAEVSRHLPDWAARKHLDPDAAQLVWERVYLPLLRCVAVPDGLTTKRESARLAVLAAPHHPHGDPDDVPSATLALLVGAPFLSKDANPLRAVYGPDFDHVNHAQWLRALAAGGDLGPLGQYMQSASIVTLAFGYGGYAAVRGIVRRVPWPWLVALGVGAIGLGAKLVRTDESHHEPSRARRIFGQAFELFGEIVVLHSAAQRQFDTLAAPRPSWDEVTADVGAPPALARSCLHELARSPESDLSAEELAERLRVDEAMPHGKAKVRAALRAGTCFEEVYRGRFQVGAALVREPVSPDGERAHDGG